MVQEYAMTEHHHDDEEESSTEHDFLAIPVFDESDGSEQEERNLDKSEEDGKGVVTYQYRSKKPKWWFQLSGRATKPQRRAMREMGEHMLPRQPYGGGPVDWKSVFDVKEDFPIDDIWIEFGFGSGENLLRLAEMYHNTHERRFFVGAEIHASGVGRALIRMQEGIENNRYWTDYTLYSEKIDPFAQAAVGGSEEESAIASRETQRVENPYSNLRIHRGDGVKLLPYIPASTVGAVLLTNPDPFPSKSYTDLRVIQAHTVVEFRRVLRLGGRLYLATDDPGFFEWSLSVLDLVNEDEVIFKQLDPCPDRKEWLPVVSNYEQKAWESGRYDRLVCWEAV